MANRAEDSKMSLTMSTKESPGLDIISKAAEAENCSLAEAHAAKLSMPTLLETDINLPAVQA